VVVEGEQLGFVVRSVDSVIESLHADARAEVRRMAEDAIEFINRSFGQVARRVRERHEREYEQFWITRIFSQTRRAWIDPTASLQ
jgi:hypothetical protein